MDFGIQNKTALILGGGGGLGSAIARTLAEEGALVTVADVDQTAVDQCVQEIRTKNRPAMGLQWDIGDLSLVDQNVKAIEEQFGPVDILINNTGGPPPTPAAGQDPAQWGQFFQSMVVSVISITDRVLPGMKQNKWGRIITSTSSGVISPIPNLGISNALRLSLVGWSKTLSREVARDGITANIILPGRIATQRISFLDTQKAARENRTIQDVVAESTSSIPAGRYGEPQEYADAVAFLASKRASYITGSVIRVDGGMISSV